MFRTCSFICLRLFCGISSFHVFLGFSILRANLASIEKRAAGKVGLTLPWSSSYIRSYAHSGMLKQMVADNKKGA